MWVSFTAAFVSSSTLRAHTHTELAICQGGKRRVLPRFEGRLRGFFSPPLWGENEKNSISNQREVFRS